MRHYHPKDNRQQTGQSSSRRNSRFEPLPEQQYNITPPQQIGFLHQPNIVLHQSFPNFNPYDIPMSQMTANPPPFLPSPHEWSQPYPVAPQMISNQLAYPPQPMNMTSALGKLQLPPEQITDTGIKPNLPYYELPAGLMVPLVPPSQFNYKPLNPSDLRLPLPKFPDENFLKTIDAYYGSDGKTRDTDGWDREFIDTFISQKKALAECSAKGS